MRRYVGNFLWVLLFIMRFIVHILICFCDQKLNFSILTNLNVFGLKFCSLKRTMSVSMVFLVSLHTCPCPLVICTEISLIIQIVFLYSVLCWVSLIKVMKYFKECNQFVYTNEIQNCFFARNCNVTIPCCCHSYHTTFIL